MSTIEAFIPFHEKEISKIYTIHVSLSVSCDDVTIVDDKWTDGMGWKEDDIIMKLCGEPNHKCEINSTSNSSRQNIF